MLFASTKDGIMNAWLKRIYRRIRYGSCPPVEMLTSVELARDLCNRGRAMGVPTLVIWDHKCSSEWVSNAVDSREIASKHIAARTFNNG